MSEPTPKTIAFDSLKEKVLNKSIILIDVREPKELQEDGKIPHSVNIPLGEVVEDIQLPDFTFRKKYGIEKPAKSDDIAISCRSGRRAMNACKQLLPLGYERIRVYSGSFEDWKSRGGPIEKD